MKHVNYKDVELEVPSEKDIKDLKIRWLITEKDGGREFCYASF